MPISKVTYGRVSISNVKSAITNYKYKYYLAMKRLMRDAAGVFVKTAVGYVHKDTGMSAASLEPFARDVKTSILNRIARKRLMRKGAMSMSGRYYPKRVRSIEEGLKAGQTAYKINYGTYQRPYMMFNFQVKVWQYWYWEPQWQSLNEASINAEIFIDKNYKKYLPEGLKTPFKYGWPNVTY